MAPKIRSGAEWRIVSRINSGRTPRRFRIMRRCQQPSCCRPGHCRPSCWQRLNPIAVVRKVCGVSCSGRTPLPMRSSIQRSIANIWYWPWRSMRMADRQFPSLSSIRNRHAQRVLRPSSTTTRTPICSPARRADGSHLCDFECSHCTVRPARSRAAKDFCRRCVARHSYGSSCRRRAQVDTGYWFLKPRRCDDCRTSRSAKTDRVRARELTSDGVFDVRDDPDYSATASKAGSNTEYVGVLMAVWGVCGNWGVWQRHCRQRQCRACTVSLRGSGHGIASVGRCPWLPVTRSLRQSYPVRWLAVEFCSLTAIAWLMRHTDCE